MRTVRARLTLFTIAVVAVILGLMGAFVRLRVEANLIAEVDRALRDDIGAVTTRADAAPLDVLLPGVSRIALSHNSAVAANRITEVLRDRAGEVRLDAKWNAPKLIPAGGHGASMIHADDPMGVQNATAGEAFHDFWRKAEPMRSLTAPVRRAGATIAYVQAVRSLAPAKRGLADLDRALWTSIPIAILLAALGGALLVQNAMRPLRRMIEAAGRLERDPAAARLPTEGRDEFAALALGINAAFEAQNRVLSQLERFTGDAGHELRTPLASIKTNASYLLHIADVPAEHRPPLELIDASVDRMTKLIGDLLLLARQDAGRSSLSPSDVCPERLVRALAATLPNPCGVAVEVRIDPALVVRADVDTVERVLLNLLSNALRHARERVAVTAEATGGALTVEVRDDGEGIAAEHLPRLGERFFRPDESRSRVEGGVGLGLAIARSLAESHGGELTLESREGAGTVARSRFRLG